MKEEELGTKRMKMEEMGRVREKVENVEGNGVVPGVL